MGTSDNYGMTAVLTFLFKKFWQVIILKLTLKKNESVREVHTALRPFYVLVIDCFHSDFIVLHSKPP